MEKDCGEAYKMSMIIGVKSKDDLIGVIFYTVVLFPILGENIISSILENQISKAVSIISCAIILFICLIYRLHMSKFHVVLLLLILVHVGITFSAVFSGIEITVANNIITPYGLIGYFMLFLLIDVFMGRRDKIIVLFKSMSVIMTLSVFMNFFFTADMQLADNISVLNEAFSTGYTNSRQWLFGHRNMIFIHHLMWMLFSFIVKKIQNRSYTKLFVFQEVFTMLVGVVSWNSTMMFCTFLIFVIAIIKDNILSKITVLHYILIYAVLEIGIVFFRIQETFSYLIVNILHRNLSFTGRTSIWDYYIKQFVNSSILHKLFGNIGETALKNNSHNMFLGLLAFTGIIGLMLYLLLLYLSAVNLMKEKFSDSARFVSIILFGFLVNSLTMEFYLQPMLAMFIGYKIKEINALSCEGPGEQGDTG